jgi:hypothetical protein
MERIVVEQISKLGQDPGRLKTILTEASKQRRTRLVALAEARRGLEQELARAQALTENLRQKTRDQKQQPASELEAAGCVTKLMQNAKIIMSQSHLFS